MHLLYYSFIIVTFTCKQKRNAILFLRDVLNKRCFEFLCSAGLRAVSTVDVVCLSAPFLTHNLIILHMLKAIRSEHMPHCVLQGNHGPSLQWLLLSWQGQAAGHHVYACISMPCTCSDRCSWCLWKGTWWGIKAPWQHIRPKPWTPTQVAAESQFINLFVSVCVCVCINRS